MRDFKKSEKMLLYKGGVKSRLIYYCDDEWEPEEKEMIEQYKKYCASNGVKIPATEPEILRFLYSKKFDPA